VSGEFTKTVALEFKLCSSPLETEGKIETKLQFKDEERICS